jgi:adenine-specific DNA methylase
MDKSLDTPIGGVSAPSSSFEELTPWRPIHYLGSKLRLLEPVKAAIDSVSSQDEAVCDLFAGSGTVAAALSFTRNVVAADIQEYSRVLCSAILLPSSIGAEIRSGIFSDTFERDLSARLERVAPLIQYEEEALAQARRGHPEAICDLIEHASLVTTDWMSSSEGNRAQREVAKLLAGTEPRLGTVMIRHYGGLYFSYKQAAYLDALLASAHKAASPLRETLLAIAVSTASEIVNTVGKQFAQPIQPRDSSGDPKRHLIAKIVRDRGLEASEAATRWASRYDIVDTTSRMHRVIKGDYVDTLTAIRGEVGVVYADPPYTREHYSRFYHVLETMCLGDEPTLSTTRIRAKEPRISRGVYRAERHQSPFCIRSQAPGAFNAMFAGVKHAGASLVLSYSPFKSTGTVHPRVMTIEQILSLAKPHFANVEVASAGRISHSKLNATQHHLEAGDEAEVIITCR